MAYFLQWFHSLKTTHSAYPVNSESPVIVSLADVVLKCHNQLAIFLANFIDVGNSRQEKSSIQILKKKKTGLHACMSAHTYKYENTHK